VRDVVGDAPTLLHSF